MTCQSAKRLWFANRRDNAIKLSWSWVYCVPAVWVGFLLASPGVGNAGDWPQWRGPTGVGCTDEKGLPLTWDGKTGKLYTRVYDYRKNEMFL